jgi:hypothetical protein
MNPKQQHILKNIKLLAPQTDTPNLKENWQPVEPGALWGFNCFPDGQIQAYVHKSLDFSQLVVKARLIDAELVMAYDQLTALMDDDRDTTDIVTYWYGARSDKEEAGDFRVSDVRSLVAHNLWGSVRIKVFYPHSDIRNTVDLLSPVVSPYGLDLTDCGCDITKYDGIIFPDMSAEGRFDKDLNYAGLQTPRYHCLKTRDQVTGEVTRHEIPQLPKTGKFLVMDDLCDGGRTFIDIVTLGKNALSNSFDLFVPHGVFSNSALGKLQRAGYEKIFTTNSYQDFNTEDQQDMIKRGILHVEKVF